MNLTESLHRLALEKESYYREWLYDLPIIVRQSTYDRLKDAHDILHRLIRHFVLHYDRYADLMPISEKARQIIAQWSDRAYNVGTFRTDLIFGWDGSMKFIEITCRFSLNGYFLGPMMNIYGEQYLERSRSDSFSNINPYESLLDHIEKLRGDTGDIYVLVGDDRGNESKLYNQLYSLMGVTVHFINYRDIDSRLDDMAGQLIVMELSLEEIESLDISTIHKLSTQKIINDIRTILLIHDKRFFSVLGNNEFLRDVLSTEEIILFKSYCLPTYAWEATDVELRDDVRMNKNKWIIKHRSLGKSKEIYAGVNQTNAAWGTVVDGLDHQYTVQRWLEQRIFPGSVDTAQYNDYVTGTLLFFDEHFYGFGDFRTSSNPVINKTDHRKMCSVILADDDIQNLQFDQGVHHIL